MPIQLTDENRQLMVRALRRFASHQTTHGLKCKAHHLKASYALAVQDVSDALLLANALEDGATFGPAEPSDT